MNEKDVYLLGLLALAYFFVDGRADPAPVARRLPAHAAAPAWGPAQPGVVPAGVCPRGIGHPVLHRKHDDAVWCLVCDEAFYPQGAIFASVTGEAA